MNQKEAVIYILGDSGGNLTRIELTNLWYECFPERVDARRRQFASREQEITEKKLFTKIGGELTSYSWHNPELFVEDRNSNDIRFSLSDEGKLLYQEIISRANDETDEYTPEDVSMDDIEENIEDNIDNGIVEENIGIVYLLISSRYSDTYKIGVTTRSIEYRLNELKSDRIYGLFNLQPKMYVKCIDFNLIERVLHKFFEDFRMGTDRNRASTELFQGITTIEEEFEMFVKMLQENPRYKSKIKELIKL